MHIVQNFQVDRLVSTEDKREQISVLVTLHNAHIIMVKLLAHDEHESALGKGSNISELQSLSHLLACLPSILPVRIIAATICPKISSI